MRKLVTAVVLAIAGYSLAAQEAYVEALSAQDAKDAQAKWAAVQKAQVEWNDFREHISTTYLDAGEKAPSDCFGKIHFKRGWGCGEFEFSKDLKFIVPKMPGQQQPFSQSCFIATPAKIQ